MASAARARSEVARDLRAAGFVTNTGRSDRERLELFCRGVSEVIERRAIQECTISAAFTVRFDEGQEVVEETDGSDVEDVRSLVLAFRKFHATKEDVHFYRIAKIVATGTKSTAADLFEANAINLDSWKRIERESGIDFEVHGVHHTPKDWFDIWVNGGMFHEDVAASRTYDSLAPPLSTMIRHTVHGMVVEGIHVLHAERNLIEEATRRGLFA